ncbi:fatty acid--CoA ligase family protein, partial [Gammaproteobacteria bacterium]|nr:fatty acid--CoA ligase family protein [Gammaproteobacteria bacterium]
EKTLVLSEPGQDLPGQSNVVPLDDDWDRLVAGQCTTPARRVDADCPALVMLTSGSSGEPKAVASTHREQYWRYLQMNLYLPGSVSDIYLSAMPLSFSAGNNYIFNYLMSGATVALHPVMFSISELIETINRLQVTALFLVPTIVERLVAEADGHGLLLPRVEKLLVGAAPVSTQTKLRCMDTVTPNFYNIYAASGAGWIAIADPKDARAHPNSAGRCMATSEVQIVDEQDQPLPSGQSGRIRCRGETVTRRFYPGFPMTDQNETYLDGFYYPGDLGYFDQHGYLYLNGRASTIIIRDGINVFPEQVEKALINHHNVDEVAVCGIPSREHGEEVVVSAMRRFCDA